MATISDALAIATLHQQAGRIRTAEEACRQILRIEPHHAGAFRLLGVMAETVNRLGADLMGRDKPDEAAVCFQRAAELRPDYAEAYYNLGLALRRQGKADPAAACWRQALSLQPEHAESHYNLGISLMDRGRLEEAAAHFRQAVKLKPDFVAARDHLRIASPEDENLEEAPAGASGERTGAPLCKFLQSREEIASGTAFLARNGYISHHLQCKNWDLALILPEIGEGNFLDLGSSDSYILRNVVRKRIPGAKQGIDLRPPTAPVKGVDYAVGDLMDSRLPSAHFDYITCLSVIEHQVDFGRFAREVSRLLKRGGKAFVTFDYWEPRVTPPINLYGLAWQPLDRALLECLIKEAGDCGLSMLEALDWSLGERVIRDGYYSPHPKVAYTFGIITLVKM